jgi:hypothetical protein
MLPDRVGAVNCLNKVCGADGALSRPAKLPTATTTMFIVVSKFNNEIGTLVLVILFTSLIMAPVNAFLTCTAVAP